MTVTDIARMMASRERYQRQSAEPKLPNGSTPPPGYVNPYCPEGLDITGMKSSDYKIIPVDKNVEQKMKDITLEEIKRGYGKSDPYRDPVSDLIKSYDKQIPAKDRINAGWTLEKVHQREVRRIFDFIKSRVPGWEAGKPFDTSILDEYQQGIDMNA